VSRELRLIGLGHDLVALVQNAHDERQLLHHARGHVDEQHLLGVGREPQIRGRLALRQLVDPAHEVLPARAVGQHQLVGAVADLSDYVVVFFERRGRHEALHQPVERLEVAFVVDLAAVHLRDEHAQNVPWDVLGCDVGAVFGH